MKGVAGVNFSGLTLRHHSGIDLPVKGNEKENGGADFQAMLEAEQKRMESHSHPKQCDSESSE